MKASILKNYRKSLTFNQIEISEVAQSIQDQKYLTQCKELREVYPLAEARQRLNAFDNTLEVHTKDLPKVCFAAVWENKNKQQVMRQYNGLVLLEVNNLSGTEEAEAVRKGAAQIPQTMMAFVGASGRSVKIVCRGELFPTEGHAQQEQSAGPLLPQSDDDIKKFHTNLYEKARVAYNMQLGVTIEKLEPELTRSCFMSADLGLLYNPYAQAFYIDCDDTAKSVQPITLYAEQQESMLPGLENYQAMHHVYEFCLTKAYDDTVGISEEEGRTHLILTRLADNCKESGLPMAFAQRLVKFRRSLGADTELVDKVFENAYREEQEKQYLRRKNIVKPLKHIPAETLLIMKIDMFLNSNYELRKNVMRGVAEYRMRSGIGFDFQDLTEEARNSITMKALSQGVKCWDKDISRYVNSNDIEQYEPMTEFLDQLPKWDGKDRVEPLARRIKTDYEEWPHLFHIWMRSMVAMWRGKGQLTGNALVPILIGRQGCGKTSFCRLLLPRDLRIYYNDRINFKNESDLNLGLTSFALINLDEFDKITNRQQVVLKYLVSTSDLKYRPPYGKAYASHRRYASFIGTTNESTPLTDPSGNRRFICVTVEDDIDFTTPIDYEQLYAQLEYEVSVLRLPYHLTRDEEHTLMEHNLCYEQISQLREQLLALYEKPEGTPQTNPDGGKWIAVKDISARLKDVFKGAYKYDDGSYVRIGMQLSRPEYRFEKEKNRDGFIYWVKERLVDDE